MTQGRKLPADSRKTRTLDTQPLIEISSEEVAEFLEEEIEREPTPEEVKQFEEYLVDDIYEWMRDNYKAWSDHVQYEYSLDDIVE